MPVPIVIIVLGFIALCIGVDLRTRRIPNLLSGSAILAGPVLNALYFGRPGLLASLVGFALTVGILLGPFALGGIGGGDVKMMGAVGALLGPRLALAGVAAGMILGGAIMTLHLLRRGRLREKLAATGEMVTVAAWSRSLTPLKVSATDRGAIALPYSVPLGLGTVAVLALSGAMRSWS